MSSTLVAVKNMPVRYWPLGTVSPYYDHSGFDGDGSSSATPDLGVSLAYGVDNSTIFDSECIATLPCGLFKEGSETIPFTLTGIVRTIDRAGGDLAEQQIIGNDSLMDGLTIEGTVVSFVIKFDTAAEARASFDIQIPRRVHVFGVYTREKIVLYIDGAMVAQTPLTEEQKADVFAGTGDNLYSGDSSSDDQAIAVNGLGVYGRALTSSEIENIFSSALAVTEDIWREYGGHLYGISQDSTNIFYEQVFSTISDWSLGTLDQLVVTGDTLFPTFSSGTSLEGVWTGVFPLLVSGEASIYGVNITWDGIGVEVEVSTDTESWEEVYRGKNIEAVPPDFDPTNQALFVRVTFPGGIENDPSYLNSLTLTGIASGTEDESTFYQAPNDREIRFTGSPLDIRRNRPAQTFSEEWGAVSFDDGGTIAVIDNSTAEDAPFVPKTIEVWLKAHDTDIELSSNFDENTVIYMNGDAFSAYSVGEWAILHYVNENGIDGDVSFTGPVQVGRITYYEDKLSQSSIQDILESYNGTNSLVIEEDSDIEIAESEDSPQLFAYDWTLIVPSK